MKRIGKKDT
ncbi:hypothetical protein CAEBREN_13918 [Caenorhabditis brenneri]|uniref:Uncharacterized protein n=1 Tax=Caenorhabditis brenneri TaxID=135651 RepID=G0MD11_CAEBE|nr:hypothetical protein CAEBREN_13918 [Caenorhabditis brenneri]